MKKLTIILLILLSIQGFSQTDSLSLENAIGIALENNYGIITSKKNINISETNNSWGMVGALPTVSFGSSASQNSNYNSTNDYTTTSLGASVDMNWVLFRGFAAKIQKQKLDEYENISNGNLAVTVENTINDVVLAYYNVLLEQEKVEIAEKNMKLSQDRFDREQLRKEIGNSVSYDLLQAQNAYLQDKSDFKMRQSTLKNAKRQLNYLMAAPVNSEFLFSSTFEADTANFEYADLLQKMKSNNKTLQNQYINLELAKLEAKSAKSSYYPTVTVGLSGGYADTDMDYSTMNQLDNSSTTFTTGVNVGISYAIFQGGTRKRMLKVAEIDEEIKHIETKDMEQALENQLAQEYEMYEVRKELLVLAEQNMKAAKLNFDLTKEKFQSGAINSFNYRDVQNLYLNSSLNYQSAIYNMIQSYYTLLRLTGGIIEDNE